MAVAAGLAASAGFAVAAAAGFAVSAGFAVAVDAGVAAGFAAADRTAVMAKSRRKQKCFIVVHREKEFAPRVLPPRKKNTQLNIDLKRENANGKVKTRAKKAQKKE